jgi:hypothetical protein
MAIWPTSLKADAKAGRRPVTLVLHLSCEDGGWRVTRAARDEGAAFVRDFKEANPGAGPVESAGAGMMGVRGVVTNLDDKSLTVRPINRWPRAPAPAERTFALDEQTRVLVPEYSREQQLPGGRSVHVYKAVPGKREDLEVGQQVSLEWPPGEARAARVSISHADNGGGPGLGIGPGSGR